MGLRIHKVLGYGLTDVKTDGCEITDSRFNKNSILINAYAVLTYCDYLDFLKQKQQEIDDYELKVERSQVKAFIKKAQRCDSMNKYFTYDCGEGCPSVIVITPCYHEDWIHYDDPIDYAEEVGRGTGPENRWKVLNGIFPYLSYFNRKTGERFPVDGKQLIDNAIRNMDSGYGTYKENQEYLDTLCRSYGLKDSTEYGFVAPIVPPPVRYMAEFAQVFNKPETINELKPLLYTYWS